MESAERELIPCSNCGADISLQSNFCKNCGVAINQKEIKYTSEKKKNLQSIAVFFAVELVICVWAMLIEEYTIRTSLFFDITMAIIAILFFSLDWKENKFLLKWANFSLKKLVSLAAFTLVCGVAVQFLVTQLNHFVFEKDYVYFTTYADHKYGKYIMVVSIAVFPALFEELAYRGFLMQKLLKVVEPNEAIAISSILFFFVHFSMVSFFWMLPLAFLFGYVRMKYNTIWYGVIMHFCFNLVTCLLEIYKYSSF